MLEWLSRVLVRGRWAALALVLGTTVALGLALPSLEANPSPRALLSSADPAQAEVSARLAALYPSSDQVVVVLLTADDVLALPALRYSHRLSQALSGLEVVARVDGLTTLPWPREPEPDAAPTLEDLDTELPELSPEALAAASDLVMAAPDAFPAGMASLSEMGDRKVEPLVTGSEVSEQDAQRVRAAVASAKVLERRLISADHRHTLLAVTLATDPQEHTELEAAVASLEASLAQVDEPPGVTRQLAGLPIVRKSLVDHMRSDQAVLIPGTLLACLVVLLLSFRWLPAVVLPLLVVGLTTIWLLGGMALFHERLNVLNNILPALVIIIGLTDAVHIIGRYMEEQRALGDARAAVLRTVETMGVACLMTTVTSAIGLASLMVSQTQMLARFGLVGALGLLVAYLVTLLVVAPLLSLLKAPKVTHASERRGLIEHVVLRLTRTSVHHPRALLLVALASLLGAGAYARSLVVDSALLDQFDPSDPVRQTTELLERDFEGVRPLELAFLSDAPGVFFEPKLLEQLGELAAWTRHQPGVIRVDDPGDTLALAWSALTGRELSRAEALGSRAQVDALARLIDARDGRPLRAVMTPDGKSVRLRVRLRDIGAKRTGQLVEELEARASRIAGQAAGVRFAFDGDAYVSASGLSAVVADLVSSVSVAALLIMAVLFVLFRSLRLAVLSIPPNLIPQVWTLAWMVWRDIPLNASSAIIFSLSVGVSVDSSIHILSRFREEAAHGALSSVALVRALSGTGRNIIISSLALMLGFSVMFFSGFVPVRRFAELIAVSLSGCLIATLLLQPALLELFGPRGRR